MFVWGLCDDFMYELLLLKIIFSIKKGYVRVWVILCAFLLLKIIFNMKMCYVYVWGL